MRHIRHLFAWLGGITFIAICLAVIAASVARMVMVPRLEHRIFVTHSASTATPATYGTPYRTVTIDSNGRTLQAWTVDAGAASPALLLFHGNGETIHDFARVQAYLYRHGISSMAFDYSGFGASTGTATIAHLNEDAEAAWRVFASWAGALRPKFVLGYSLGTAVALHNVPDFRPQPLGVIVYGAFSSARKVVPWIVLGFPQWLEPLAPDLWDNVRAASRLREPLLVVAGMDDVKVPPYMGRRVALFAGDGANYVLIPDAGHGAIVNNGKMDAVWRPILTFVDRLAGAGATPDVRPPAVGVRPAAPPSTAAATGG